MKVKSIATITILLLLSLTGLVWKSQAQSSGPLLIIQGSPIVTDTAPPQVRTYVSVIDKGTGAALTPNSFQLTEAGQTIPADSLTISSEQAGLAVVVVIDMGGISLDDRLKQAADLGRDLVNSFSANGTPNDDIIAIIGVGEDGTLYPAETERNFTYNPVDRNRLLNTLTNIQENPVRGVTPLYEGVDEALRLLTENSDTAIRNVLAHRRKIVVVLSDGIDRGAGVDEGYSIKAQEDDIIRKAQQNHISLYPVGMARVGRDLDADATDNLIRLARQTAGLYLMHNSDEAHQPTLDLFGKLATQGQQHLLSYPSLQPKGNYNLHVLVETSIGSAEQETTFFSNLEASRIALVPPSELAFTIAYSSSLKGFVPTTITLGAQVTSMDGIVRNPSEVRYLANGELIGVSAVAPDYTFLWGISALKTPAKEAQEQEFTLTLEATDAYLGTKMFAEQPITLRVSWEALPPPDTIEIVEQEVRESWWFLIPLVASIVGLIILFILLRRTRGQIGRQVVSRATGFLKGMTRKLPDLSQGAPGKLVIVQGANVGREYPLIGSVVKVGRDSQMCDFALHDEFVSNPHFSIHIEQTEFYIEDEGSTNGTKLNGMPLDPHQREPLPPDAIIHAASTKIEFKRLKRDTTRIME